MKMEPLAPSQLGRVSALTFAPTLPAAARALRAVVDDRTAAGSA